MPVITNPMEALNSFQVEVKRGLPVEQCATNRDLSVMYDEPNGKPRYSYAKIEWGKVKAFVMFVLDTPINEIPTFNIGYAVPEFYQNKGFGREIVRKSIEEFSGGLAGAGIRRIYVRAVVDLFNDSSNKIARDLLSPSPEEIIDDISGKRAFHYTLLIEQ